MTTTKVIAKNVGNARPTSGHAFAYAMGHAIGQEQTGNQASPGGVGA